MIYTVFTTPTHTRTRAGALTHTHRHTHTDTHTHTHIHARTHTHMPYLWYRLGHLLASFAWPDQFRAATYCLEIISASLHTPQPLEIKRGAYNFQSTSGCAERPRAPLFIIWPSTRVFYHM